MFEHIIAKGFNDDFNRVVPLVAGGGGVNTKRFKSVEVI